MMTSISLLTLNLTMKSVVFPYSVTSVTYFSMATLPNGKRSDRFIYSQFIYFTLGPSWGFGVLGFWGFGVYLGYTWGILGVSLGYTWGILGVYLGYTWGILGVYLGYTWVILGAAQPSSACPG
jgi:hypothetical protein